MGYFGEAMLRFIGVGVGTVRELRAAQLTKIANNLRSGLFSAVDGINLANLSKKEIGELGERIGQKFLKENGFTDIIAIQNKSGNGIDIVAKGRNGRLSFFEVKTSAAGKVGSLSVRQQDMQRFVRQILTDAAERRGRYRNIDQDTRAWAAATLRQFQKDPLSISGDVIGVDLLNQTLRVSPWR